MATLRTGNVNEILRAAAKRITNRIIKEESEKAAAAINAAVKTRIAEELYSISVDIVENTTNYSMRPEFVIVVNDKKETE